MERRPFRRISRDTREPTGIRVAVARRPVFREKLIITRVHDNVPIVIQNDLSNENTGDPMVSFLTLSRSRKTS